MIDNNPSKSIRSVARDMGVPEFLIKLVEHEDILVFLMDDKKGPIFITGHER